MSYKATPLEFDLADLAGVSPDDLAITTITIGPPGNRHLCVRVELVDHEKGTWAVRAFGECFTRKETWVDEPSPSYRTEEFLALTRFPLAMALMLAGKACERLRGEAVLAELAAEAQKHGLGY